MINWEIILNSGIGFIVAMIALGQIKTMFKSFNTKEEPKKKTFSEKLEDKAKEREFK